MKQIVLVGGCFDLLHFGHISFLKQAKALGEYLVVALESDENVRRMKGDARPVHTQSQRKEMLESLSFVDEVIPLPPMQGDRDYYELVRKIKPSIIAITQGDSAKSRNWNRRTKSEPNSSSFPKSTPRPPRSFPNSWDLSKIQQL